MESRHDETCQVWDEEGQCVVWEFVGGVFLVKAVHEFFTNARMDGAIFVHSWFYSWMVSCFAGVVRQVSGLIESLLAKAFEA